MPRRKQAKRTTVKDLRSILRLTYEQGLSVRAISERLQISKTSVATYLLRAREAGLSWPLPAIYESEAALQRALFRRVGRPPQDLREPEWPRVAALAINAISYSSVSAILKSGLDRASSAAEPVKAAPSHANIRGGAYYQ